MGLITFVRHGQAMSHATTEADYDRLSDTGIRQAALLGDWFRTQGETFDLVMTGTLRRQIETAAHMGMTDTIIDPRLNEMDYYNLSAALAEVTGAKRPSSEEFADHIVQLMESWHRAEICGNETFASFEARVAGVLSEAAQPGRNILCITSGGVIAMIMRHLLGLDLQRLAQLTVPIFNTSVHRVHVTHSGAILSGFNAIPHLEPSDRAADRTHY